MHYQPTREFYPRYGTLRKTTVSAIIDYTKALLNNLTGSNAMNIGLMIKKLRRERDMTQEQLAEYLSVSAQAVSRWETGTALPDITQIPALANVFDVSADVLLGIDITAKEKRINEIADDAWFNHAAKGYPERAAIILRSALKEYPNSYRLMSDLVINILSSVMSKPNKKEELDAAYNEAAALGEKILAECLEDDLRYGTIQRLCILYPQIGRQDRALELAMKMPPMVLSREMLLDKIYTGTEMHNHKQNVLQQLLDFMWLGMSYYNTKLDNGNDAYTLDERIEIQQKILAIYDIMIEDRNFLFNHERLSIICRNLTRLYIEKGDKETALKYLRHAASHAIEYDNSFNEEKEYTNILFRGQKVGSVSSNTPNNQSSILLKILDQKHYDVLRGSAEYSKIESELKEHAGIRT